MGETLRTCTLAADAMAKKGDVDESRPWRMRKISGAEQMLKSVEKLETPGAQLKALVAAYARQGATRTTPRRRWSHAHAPCWVRTLTALCIVCVRACACVPQVRVCQGRGGEGALEGGR